MRQLLVLSAVLATAIVCPGCDLAPRVASDTARETWTRTERDARQRLESLRERQTAIAARLNELRDAPGADDPKLVAAISALQEQITAVGAALAAAQATLQQAVDGVEAALARPNKLEARRAIESGMARIEAALTAAATALEAPAPTIASTQEALSRNLASLAAEKQRVRQIAIKGGTLVLDRLAFGADDQLVTEPGPGRNGLDLALALASGCDAIRFKIEGHTSRATPPDQQKAVSKARAAALRSFLLASGVAATKIEAIEGLGASQPVTDEPAPGTAAAQALPPEQLAARQQQNQRLELVVTRPCGAEPTDADAANAPDTARPDATPVRGAPRALAPIAAPPTAVPVPRLRPPRPAGRPSGT